MMRMAARFKGLEEEPGSEEDEEEGPWEYDSTWEDEGGEEEEEGRGEGRLEEERKEKEESEAASDAPKPGKAEKPRSPRRALGGQEGRRPNRSPMSFGRYKSTSRRNWIAAKDMQRYRHHYPDLEETDTEIKEDEMWNLSFYKNEISFVPRGLHIEDLLETWQHDYAVMEENHSYIQWLFPLREPGMNWRAKLLTLKEIQAFKKSKDVMDTFVRAYKLMLGFYGIELTNEETGELRRADNYFERFWNLNQYSHNNLRITRILKCLGEMGLERYQVQLVKFFLTETLVNQMLPRVKRSALDYFVFTVRDKRKRRELVYFAWQHFTPKHEFVWGPRKKLLEFKPPSPELHNNVALEEEQKPAKDGAGAGLGQQKSHLPHETSIVENAVGRSSDDVRTKPGSDRDAAEPQPGLGSEPKAPGKMEEPNSGPAANVKSEGEDVKEGSELDRKDLTGDCGSSGSGADGESLKESKKRKLEANKLSGEGVGLSRSPIDIEKISSNLEEVVIDHEGPGSLQLMENSKPLIPEGNGGDRQDLKEADSVRAMVKRRKVDEMASEDSVAKTAQEPDTEATSFESQVPSIKVPSFEKTEEVKISTSVPVETQHGTKTAGDVNILVDSKTCTAKSGEPSGDCVPDKPDESVTTSTIEGEGAQSCLAPIMDTKDKEGASGQEEGEMKGKAEDAADLSEVVRATESVSTLAKPDEGRNPR
ncbi:opioid growth factor receptor [Eublepharis macularius]|uniref:Opioid growth factor receptor n=1 Tax=Eublepharis macularius TaxID=481883 RepID=A0AA97L0R6_EUBMA|nr:opioid growth factor receptor [Eublepharis macularius]